MAFVKDMIVPGLSKHLLLLTTALYKIHAISTSWNYLNLELSFVLTIGCKKGNPSLLKMNFYNQR